MSHRPVGHFFTRHAGWTVTMTPDGGCTWIGATGRTREPLFRTGRDFAA